MTGRRKIQRTSFPIGMVNRTLHGRIDREEYPYAAADIYNMIITRDSTVKRRNGMGQVIRIENVDKIRLIPFERSEDKSFVLAFSHLKLQVIQLNKIQVSESIIFTVTTEWTEAEIDDIDYVQSGDRMWIVHPNHIPHTFTYTGVDEMNNDTFELETMDIKWDERLHFLQRPFGVLSTTEEIPGLIFRGDLVLETFAGNFSFIGPRSNVNGGSGDFSITTDNTGDPDNQRGSLTTTGEFAIDYNIPNSMPTVSDTGTNRLRYIDHNEALRRDIAQIRVMQNQNNFEIRFYFPDTSDLKTKINENQATLNAGEQTVVNQDTPANLRRVTFSSSGDLSAYIRTLTLDSSYDEDIVIRITTTGTIGLNDDETSFIRRANITIPAGIGSVSTSAIDISGANLPFTTSIDSARYASGVSIPITTLSTGGTPSNIKVLVLVKREGLSQEEINDIEDTITRLKNEQEDISNKFHQDLTRLFEGRSVYLIHPTTNTILAEYRYQSTERAYQQSVVYGAPRTPLIKFVGNNNPITPSNQDAIDTALNAMPPQTPPDPTYESEYRFRIIIAASGLTFTNDYPKTVSFHENRLVFGTTNNKPRTLWFSNRGIYDDFSRHIITDPVSEAETEADDSAIIIVIAGDHLNEIRWLHSDYYSLLIGTEGSIWNIRGSGDPRFTTNITHSNFILKVAFDNIGVAKVRPIQIERRIIIVEKDRRKLHEIFFSGEINTYEIRQLNYNALEIFDAPIFDMAYQREPNFLIWCLMIDSPNYKFATCTYIPEENTKGWSIQEIANNLPHGTELVGTQSIAVIPDTDGDNLFTAYTSGTSPHMYIGLIKGAEVQIFGDTIPDSRGIDTNLRTFTSRLKTLPLVIPEWWGDRVYVEEAWVRILDSQSPYDINRTTQEIRTELVLPEENQNPRYLYSGWYKINLLAKSTDNEREPSLTIETNSDGPLEIANLRAYLVQEDN